VTCLEVWPRLYPMLDHSHLESTHTLSLSIWGSRAVIAGETASTGQGRGVIGTKVAQMVSPEVLRYVLAVAECRVGDKGAQRSAAISGRGHHGTVRDVR
jgi:hypothetical protein